MRSVSGSRGRWKPGRSTSTSCQSVAVSRRPRCGCRVVWGLSETIATFASAERVHERRLADVRAPGEDDEAAAHRQRPQPRRPPTCGHGVTARRNPVAARRGATATLALAQGKTTRSTPELEQPLPAGAAGRGGERRRPRRRRASDACGRRARERATARRRVVRPYEPFSTFVPAKTRPSRGEHGCRRRGSPNRARRRARRTAPPRSSSSASSIRPLPEGLEEDERRRPSRAAPPSDLERRVDPRLDPRLRDEAAP